MLVKPQFELQPATDRQGRHRARLPALYRAWSSSACATPARRSACSVRDWFDSPIAGGDGNREFFVHAALASSPPRSHAMHRSDQLRVLPAQHAGRRRQAARPSCQSLRAAARVLQRDLRRRRLDARQDAAARCSEIAAAGHRGGAALLLRRRHARRHRARSWPPTARTDISRIVALRGDLPSGYGHRRRVPLRERTGRASSARRRAATGTSRSPPTPRSTRRQRYAAADLQALRRPRCNAGADSAITQFFFNPDAYFHFVEEARKLGARRADRAGHHADPQLRARSRSSRQRDGIEIPRWVALRMEGFCDDTASIRAFGLDVVTELCER